MLRELFINSTILVSFIFLGGQVFRSFSGCLPSPLVRKMIFGLSCGLLGSILIFFAIKVIPGTYVDLRHIAIIIAAAYGGFFPALIAAALIGAVRFTFFGISISSMAAWTNLLIDVLVCTVLLRLKMSFFKKWILMLFSTIIHSSATILLIIHNSMEQKQVELEFISGYSATMLVSGMIAYFVTEYIRRSNELFKQFQEQSSTDFLTGLSNVRKFDITLNDLIGRQQQNQEDLSMLLIDIDHFKKINDTYGHQAGDTVLKELGRLLSVTCRTIDTASRIGGEEFAIILPGCSNVQAIEVAERIRKTVQAHNFYLENSIKITITVSIGAATYPETVKVLNDLKTQADNSLYKAKRTGRNRVCSISECILENLQ